MPVAKVYVPEGILTPDQRREIVKGIHDVIVSVEQRPAEFSDLRADPRDADGRLGRDRQCICAADVTIESAGPLPAGGDILNNHHHVRLDYGQPRE